MVYIYAIHIMKYQGPEKSPTLLFSNYDISSFGFFQRGTVKELIMFFARQVIQRTKLGQKNSVQEGDYTCHAYVDSSGFGADIITDKDYPMRVALSLTQLVLKEFHSMENAGEFTKDVQLSIPKINELMIKYQDPEKADPISRLEHDLEETKDILHQSLTGLLQRGEKIEDLIEKSDDLSKGSKDFWIEARKQNQCCSYM